MAEERVPVLPVRVTFACDECGGEMKPGKYFQATNPPKYPHQCDAGHATTLGRAYPFIDYVEAPF